MQQPASQISQHILIVDDDELSRELIEIIAVEAGYAPTTLASGQELLDAAAGLPAPAAILVDMHMPGIDSVSLARLLRTQWPSATLVAISSSPIEPEAVRSFAGSLLKPFTGSQLLLLLTGAKATPAVSGDTPRPVVVLDMTVYQALAERMNPALLKQLYQLCLDDTQSRLALLRRALEQRDATVWREAAHAIRGGSGLVGATELWNLATALEHDGLPNDGDLTALDDCSAALQRLRDAVSKA